MITSTERRNLVQSAEELAVLIDHSLDWVHQIGLACVHLYYSRLSISQGSITHQAALRDKYYAYRYNVESIEVLRAELTVARRLLKQTDIAHFLRCLSAFLILNGRGKLILGPGNRTLFRTINQFSWILVEELKNLSKFSVN